MKVLLISPLSNSFEWKSVPPLGLAYLASVLRRHNHTVRILDMHIPLFARLKTLESYISIFSPELIGVSANTFGFKKTLEVIRRAKKTRPDIPIVVGGTHASVMRDKILSDVPELSFAVYGEGEFTLLELCSAINSTSDFSNILGLIWRKDKEIVTNPPRPLNNDLDGLPFASESFDLFGFDKYYSPSRSLILTSRGCPSECIYCAVHEIYGRKFRPRSPENVVDEIECLHTTYGTNHFHIIDDNFSFDLARAKRMCDEILKRKLDITWDTPNGIRADLVDPELLYKMKKSGCQHVRFGIESANQAILNGLNKHLEVNDVKKAIEWSKECGLKVSAFFLVGSPGENFESVKQSVEFALTMDIGAIFSVLTPYPRTKFWKWVFTNARWTQDPYEYLYSHGHTDQPSVPFETNDFTKNERARALKFVERTIIRKERQQEYESALKSRFPRLHGSGILKGVSILLSTLMGSKFLNLILQNKVPLELQRIVASKIR